MSSLGCIPGVGCGGGEGRGAGDGGEKGTGKSHLPLVSGCTCLISHGLHGVY